MKHTLSWQIVVPRLLLLAVTLLAAQYTVSRIARSIAVGSLQSATRAQVEANHAQVSLFDRQLVLGDLQFSSRNRPAQPVLQIDRCALDFAMTPFLYKQTIVERGLASGVRFDLPRSAASAKNNSAALRWTGDDSSEKARQWLATLNRRFEQELLSQFTCVARAEELCARWPAEAARLDERVQNLYRRAMDLQKAIGAARQNPLRNAEFFHEVPEDVATLRGEFNRVRAELDRFVASVDADRRQIALARRSDEQLVRNELRIEPIDAESLSAYLLREQIRAPLDQVISLLRWVREEVPAQTVAARRCGRGVEVLFAGRSPTPNLLVRKLFLQGAAQFGDQLVGLRGTLEGLTDAPSLYSSPIRLRLRGTGSAPVVLQATIDRNGPVARDALVIDCRGIVLPKLSLGHAEELRLALAPAVGTLSVNVLVDGERLSGDIHFVQKQVRIVPVFMGGLSDLAIAAALQETLADVQSIVIRVALSGSLNEPRSSLWSNAGTVVAEAMERAVHHAADQRARSVVARAQRRVDEQLAGLDRLSSEQQSEWRSQIATATSALAKIAGEHAPDARISHGQLGRRLPAGSLFR
jgi:uncharacterized protein (TIGR03545 family)